MSLPDDVTKKLAKILDKRQPPNWRSLVSVMPKDYYTPARIEEFAMCSLRPGGSPAVRLLEDLKRRDKTVEDLIGWLEQLKLKKLDTTDAINLLAKAQRTDYIVPPQQIVNTSPTSPLIIGHPRSGSCILGSALKLVCEAVGAGELHYQWFKDRDMLPDGQGKFLSIRSIQKEHSGNYICRVLNDYGCVFSNWAQIEVIGFPILEAMNAPLITMHPTACELFVGEELRLYCDAVGNPAPKFQWYRDNIQVQGETERELMTGGVQHEDAGMYKCEAVNKHGSVISLGAPVTVNEMRKYSSCKTVAPVQSVEGRGPDSGVSYCRSITLGSTPIDKVALLIGNEDYVYKRELGELMHPGNDTRDVAGALMSIGFKVVSLVNLTLEEMKDAVKLFCELLESNMYAVFYFAGHGFEVQGESYLMPVDASSSYKVEENLPVSHVLSSMIENRTKLNVLLLDCCRTTPQACLRDPIPRLCETMRVQQSNVVIGFGCCSQARVLESPAHTNGFFALQLVKHLGKKVKVDDVLFEVAKGIHNDRIVDPATGKTQVVYRHSTLVEDLSLCDDTPPFEFGLPPAVQKWHQIHQAPESPVTVYKNEYVSVDFTFTAEFSNVLLIHSNIITSGGESCSVHFLMPSSVGGANVEILRNKDGGKSTSGLPNEVIRISNLQRLYGELTIHMQVTYSVQGEYRRQRAFYSLQERPLYAKVAPLRVRYRRSFSSSQFSPDNKVKL